MIRYIAVAEIDNTEKYSLPIYKVVKQRYNSRLNQWVKVRDLKYTEKNLAKCH